MLLTEHKDCPPLLPLYVAINHIITTFTFTKFIPKIHCHILFMNKPFGQLVYMHHVSQSNIYTYIYA